MASALELLLVVGGHTPVGMESALVQRIDPFLDQGDAAMLWLTDCLAMPRQPPSRSSRMLRTTNGVLVVDQVMGVMLPERDAMAPLPEVLRLAGMPSWVVGTLRQHETWVWLIDPLQALQTTRRP